MLAATNDPLATVTQVRERFMKGSGAARSTRPAADPLATVTRVREMFDGEGKRGSGYVPLVGTTAQIAPTRPRPVLLDSTSAAPSGSGITVNAPPPPESPSAAPVVPSPVAAPAIIPAPVLREEAPTPTAAAAGGGPSIMLWLIVLGAVAFVAFDS